MSRERITSDSKGWFAKERALGLCLEGEPAAARANYEDRPGVAAHHGVRLVEDSGPRCARGKRLTTTAPHSLAVEGGRCGPQSRPRFHHAQEVALHAFGRASIPASLYLDHGIGFDRGMDCGTDRLRRSRLGYGASEARWPR
jgi:hypothetical protein